jgi:ABC-2 type transport system permease protein
MNTFTAKARKAWAFFIRDLRSDASYRFTMLLEFANVMATLSAFYFLSKILGNRVTGGYKPFPFLLLGMAVSSYLSTALYCFSQSIRGSQQVGVIKSVLSAPIKPAEFLFYSSTYPLFRAAIDGVAYLAAGWLLGFSLSSANLLPALLLFVLSVGAHTGIGILSATFALVFKKGDPLIWFFGGISWLMGGVFYPLEVLPGWMANLSALLPITHALRGIRMALLEGASIPQLVPELISLSTFVVITLPLSVWVFQLAVRWTRERGSLGHF